MFIMHLVIATFDYSFFDILAVTFLSFSNQDMIQHMNISMKQEWDSIAKYFGQCAPYSISPICPTAMLFDEVQALERFMSKVYVFGVEVMIMRWHCVFCCWLRSVSKRTAHVQICRFELSINILILLIRFIKRFGQPELKDGIIDIDLSP